MAGQVPKQMPAMKPPPGVTPNFVNPESLRTYWILMMCMCLTFSTMFVFMRMYTKLVLIKSHGWEDYTSFLAWLGLVGYLAIDFVAFSHGAGIHQWNVTIQDAVVYAKTVNAKEVAYAPVCYIARLSILLQFLQVFVPGRTGWAYYCIQALIWLNLLYYVAYFWVTVFICTPRRKLWDPHTAGHCVDVPAVIISAALINIVSDFWMLLIPFFCISTLQMPLRRKLGIAAVFATGLFACITSIMRAIASFAIVGAEDLTWDLIPLAFWADAELATGIIVGCLPVMPAFVRPFVPKLRSHLDSYRRSETKSTSDKGPSFVHPLSPVTPWEEFHQDSCTMNGRYLELYDRPSRCHEC